jgi:hypothetical protein
MYYRIKNYRTYESSLGHRLAVRESTCHNDDLESNPKFDSVLFSHKCRGCVSRFCHTKCKLMEPMQARQAQANKKSSRTTDG